MRKSEGNLGYHVAVQEPAAGENADDGTRIYLALDVRLLSFGTLDGPKVALPDTPAPDVVGLELEKAMGRVTALGLIAVVFQPERAVSDQSHSANSGARQASAVPGSRNVARLTVASVRVQSRTLAQATTRQLSPTSPFVRTTRSTRLRHGWNMNAAMRRKTDLCRSRMSAWRTTVSCSPTATSSVGLR